MERLGISKRTRSDSAKLPDQDAIEQEFKEDFERGWVDDVRSDDLRSESANDGSY